MIYDPKPQRILRGQPYKNIDLSCFPFYIQGSVSLSLELVFLFGKSISMLF